MADNDISPFKIDTDKIADPGLRFWVRLFRPLIHRVLCFPGINGIYLRSRELARDGKFAAAILDAMNVKYRIHAASENPIPKEGPVIVVANHPFGGVEGVALIALMEKLRPGSMVMANYILAMIPELRKYIFFVDPFGGAEAKKANLKTMKACLKWLEDGNALGVFPAGEVSSIDLKAGFVRDNVWSTTIAKMARRSNATIVPLYFSGNNGFWFNLAGLIHPRLRTLLLPKQLVNKKNRTLEVEIGSPITPHEYEAYDTDEKLTEFMRLRTYILGERAKARERAALAATKAESAQCVKQEPVVDAVEPGLLASEVAKLPEEAHLFDAEGFSVYCAETPHIPNVLREIGRLREITYRSVGEGTNSSIDLDEYDQYYRHLFIWNSEKNEIVGAYRIGIADEIVKERGVKGLYTHTCFDYDEALIDKLNPAIELGRSFVRQEYQKAYSSLMLLWKGLLTFVALNPKYKSFFGPVSISNDYEIASRGMMMRSVEKASFNGELAPLAKPRCAPKPIKKSEWLLPQYDDFFTDLDQVSKMVQEVELDQKSIPLLLRQYTKMNGKIFCFNVDPAFNFCVDGFIAVSVPSVDPRMLKRYMGAEAYESYMRHHQEAL